MANFITEKKRVQTGLKGAPTKTGTARSKRFECRVTEDELGMINELVKVLAARRNVEVSRIDMLMYLVDKEYNKQDSIRVISKK